MIRAGSQIAASFSDDASPDTRRTKQRSVSINGQVRRGNSLDWYYQLLFLCRNIKGEVKGRPHIVNAYHGMSWYQRTKLWETLREVQINITDSLPYQFETENLYQSVTKKKDTIEMVRQRAIANDPTAKKILELLHNQTAERILLDAPARRLTIALHYAQNPMALYASKDFVYGYPKLRIAEVDTSRLKSKKPGAIIRAATEYTAKSASVFSSAIDECFSRPYLSDHPLLNPVYRELRKSHAFDRGPRNYIELMEDERKEIARKITRRSYWFEQHEERSLEPLEGNLESKDSYFIQASDFAAGVASHLYELGGVFQVTQHFEYVIFNGHRISENKAYETMRKWEALGFFN